MFVKLIAEGMLKQMVGNLLSDFLRSFYGHLEAAEEALNTTAHLIKFIYGDRVSRSSKVVFVPPDECKSNMHSCWSSIIFGWRYVAVLAVQRSSVFTLSLYQPFCAHQLLEMTKNKVSEFKVDLIHVRATSVDVKASL